MNPDHHYDTISALHKSVRGGDANAALYWLCRMLKGGDDPLYVARRLIRMVRYPFLPLNIQPSLTCSSTTQASEDVGLANPQALPQALAAYQATTLLGMPECDVSHPFPCTSPTHRQLIRFRIPSSRQGDPRASRRHAS